MTGMPVELEDLLDAARERGQALATGATLGQGIRSFTTYIGLISRSIELAQLIASEKRDLKAIDSHYEIESSRIRLAFEQVENELLANVRQNEALIGLTFESINMLIAAGQHAVASEFHRRMLENLSRPSLERIVEARNAVAEGSGTRLRLT